MNKIAKRVLVAVLGLGFAVSGLQAKGWKMVDDSDGAQLICCKKYKKPAPRRVVKKKLTPCNAIPTAKTYPVKRGEKLAPANIKRCISCDQQYGTIK